MKLVPIGEALQFAGVPEKIREPASERFVTVKMNGGGAVPRAIKDGKTPVPFTGYRVRPRQFIYSRIDARNGAFALVPEELGGAVVSKDFPVFDIRENVIDPRYLIHFLNAGSLQRQIQTSSLGATNRQRITEERFLSFLIPLPSLNQQRRIAAILDEANALRDKRRQVATNLIAATQSIFVTMFADVSRRATLAGLGVDFTSGMNVLASDSDAHPTNRVIRVSAISSGHFIPGETKPMPRSYEPPLKHKITKGDMLFGRASGSLDLLGATAQVDRDCGDLFLPDKVWRIEHSRPSLASPEYILGVLRSPDFRAYVRHRASGAAGVRNIGKATVLAYRAPSPSIEQQTTYARRIASLTLQEHRSRCQLTRLDELVDSLQSRAFRGEL